MTRLPWQRAFFVVVLAGTSAAAAADVSAPVTRAPPSAAYAPAYGLRPAAASDVVKLDAAAAWQSNATTYASTLLFGKKLPSLPLGVYVRAAWVLNQPSAGADQSAFGNPLFFALYTPELRPHLKLAAFGGVTLPVGQGGGNTPNFSQRAAVASAIYGRSGLDNALFVTNYMTPTVGASLAYVKNGLTVQGEVTVLELIRVRGEAVDPEALRTNFTSGAHVGYLVAPWLTLSAEARLQVWLTTPAFVVADPSKRQQATVGAGARFNLPVGGTMLRPGLGYFIPLDAPMSRAGYRVLQVDLPIIF